MLREIFGRGVSQNFRADDDACLTSFFRRAMDVLSSSAFVHKTRRGTPRVPGYAYPVPYERGITSAFSLRVRVHLYTCTWYRTRVPCPRVHGYTVPVCGLYSVVPGLFGILCTRPAGQSSTRVGRVPIPGTRYHSQTSLTKYRRPASPEPVVATCHAIPLVTVTEYPGTRTRPGYPDPGLEFLHVYPGTRVPGYPGYAPSELAACEAQAHTGYPGTRVQQVGIPRLLRRSAAHIISITRVPGGTCRKDRALKFKIGDKVGIPSRNSQELRLSGIPTMCSKLTTHWGLEVVQEHCRNSRAKILEIGSFHDP
eukprot:3772779-Rhodomonas_salina.1